MQELVYKFKGFSDLHADINGNFFYKMGAKAHSSALLWVG